MTVMNPKMELLECMYIRQAIDLLEGKDIILHFFKLTSSSKDLFQIMTIKANRSAKIICRVYSSFV